jgi:hypothetical protein
VYESNRGRGRWREYKNNNRNLVKIMCDGGVKVDEWVVWRRDFCPWLRDQWWRRLSVRAEVLSEVTMVRDSFLPNSFSFAFYDG